MSTQEVLHTDRPERLLVITAHPDDADFGVAGSVARWVREGTVAHLVCCTSGDAGSDDADADPLELARIREAEQRAAARDRRLRGRHVPASAGRRAGQRPGAAGAARACHPHLPAGCRGRARPARHRRRARLRPARRPSGGRRGRGRCRLSGGPQRHGLPAPRQRRRAWRRTPWDASTSSGRSGPAPYVDISDTLDIKLAALHAHVSQHRQPDRLDERIRGWAAATGAAAGLAAAEAFSVIDLW